MKGRLSLLGVLLVALFAVLWMKSDRAGELPRAIDRTAREADEVPATIVPRRAEPRNARAREPISETRIASSSGDDTAPARLQIEAPPAVTPPEPPPQPTPLETAPPESTPPASTQGSAADTGGYQLTLPEEEESTFEDRQPYPWVDQVQQSQPGFVDPNRLDARTPSGDPILARPLPTGPGAGFYDPDDRYAEPD